MHHDYYVIRDDTEVVVGPLVRPRYKGHLRSPRNLHILSNVLFKSDAINTYLTTGPERNSLFSSLKNLSRCFP